MKGMHLFPIFLVMGVRCVIAHEDNDVEPLRNNFINTEINRPVEITTKDWERHHPLPGRSAKYTSDSERWDRYRTPVRFGKLFKGLGVIAALLIGCCSCFYKRFCKNYKSPENEEAIEPSAIYVIELSKANTSSTVANGSVQPAPYPLQPYVHPMNPYPLPWREIPSPPPAYNK